MPLFRTERQAGDASRKYEAQRTGRFRAASRLHAWFRAKGKKMEVTVFGAYRWRLGWRALQYKVIPTVAPAIRLAKLQLCSRSFRKESARVVAVACKIACWVSANSYAS